ncbi:MAG: hypothetical protein K6G26_07100, partial [Lachnospiraceae bacterium]|nr:hypothetical protein [Lachnospiraceae bacterium]
ELSGIYSYLLMTAGVDAVETGCEGKDMYHAWTIVTINGDAYHIDSTWGLRSYKDQPIDLTYFMMSDKARIEDGFYLDTLTLEALHDPCRTEFEVVIPATNEKYENFRGATLDSINMDKNIIRFTTPKKASLLKYED